MALRVTLGLVCVVIASLLASCTVAPREQASQLSQVAKGWCLNIRASQVIPVYPLSEDVRVGDMFIVQYPIEDEVRLYDGAGFLPLSHNIGRLAELTSSEALGAQAATTFVSPTMDYDKLPRAAFPAYSFSISRNAFANIGLPLEGVALAFGALGTESAHATVTLADASTWGMDEATLYDAARQWVASRKSLLSEFSPRYVRSRASQGDAELYKVEYSYLRVVSRVYFVRRVNVSVTDSANGNAGLAVGLPMPSELLGQASDYKQLLKQLNDGLHAADTQTHPGDAQSEPKDIPPMSTESEAILGGRVKFASMINRTVSMQETFARPVVVGYLAFDIPIGFDGELGARPISTQVRLSRRAPDYDTSYVKHWAVECPTARNDLIRWAGTEGSATRVWLQQSQLPTHIDGAVAPDGTKTPGLMDYLHEQRQLPPLLVVRLMSEVIEKPDGVRFSLERPLDEAHVMSAKVLSGDQPAWRDTSFIGGGKYEIADVNSPPTLKTELSKLAGDLLASASGSPTRVAGSEELGATYVELLEDNGYTPLIPPSAVIHAGDVVRRTDSGALFLVMRASEAFKGLDIVRKPYTMDLATSTQRHTVAEKEAGASAVEIDVEVRVVEVEELSTGDVDQYLIGSRLGKYVASHNEAYVVSSVIRGQLLAQKSDGGSHINRDRADARWGKPGDPVAVGVRLVKLVQTMESE